MKKKYIYAVTALVLITLVTISYFVLKPKPDKPIIEQSVASSEISKPNLPSLEDLRSEKGSDIKDLGRVQISTVIFQEVNQAILTTEKSDEIKVPLAVTNKDEQEFSLSPIEHSPEALRIGDTFGLAELDSHYYAYEFK